MNRILLISAVCMQIGWIRGVPHPEGVGAYAYQDSTGNSRRVPRSIIPQQPHFLRLLPPLRPLTPFKPLPPLTPLHFPCSQGRSFPLKGETNAFFKFPMQFRPFPTLFPSSFNNKARAFDSNEIYQRKALETAKKAYDITSNQAGFMPNVDFSRFSPFAVPQFQNFGMPSNFGNQNSAYAAGVAAPGFTHQLAHLSPANPNMPNVDVTSRFAENGPSNGYMSVSSSSFSSSANKNGKQETHRSAETLVNNNGKVTHYKVQD